MVGWDSGGLDHGRTRTNNTHVQNFKSEKKLQIQIKTTMATYPKKLSPQDYSDRVLQCVKSSNLHFSISETPFSVHITLRKKFTNIYRDTKEHSAAEVFKEEPSQAHQKNEVLLNLVEQKDRENSTLVHDLELKLEKAKVELSEALRKVNELMKENDKNSERFENLAVRHKIVQDNLNSLAVENKNTKQGLKQADKALKTKETDEYRLSNKIDNLETTVKKLKLDKKDLESEKFKISKENVKIQKQLVKMRERIPSVTKSTTTLTVYSSEASTSTVAMSTSIASSNTSSVTTSSTQTQTSNHPDIPYKMEDQPPPATPPNFQPSGTEPFMDTTCSLKTISLHPTNSNLLATSSLDTTPTSLVASSTLDIQHA